MEIWFNNVSLSSAHETQQGRSDGKAILQYCKQCKAPEILLHRVPVDSNRHPGKANTDGQIFGRLMAQKQIKTRRPNVYGFQLEVGAFSAESGRKRWKEAKSAKSLPGARQRLCGLTPDLVIFSTAAGRRTQAKGASGERR